MNRLLVAGGILGGVSISKIVCKSAAPAQCDESYLLKALQPLRSKEGEMRARWEKDEDGFRSLPARAWPPFQPEPDKLKELQGELEGCSDTKDHKCQVRVIRVRMHLLCG